MTKQPQFSSDTGWHQDIRYWSFERPELISVWLALTSENAGNGCLQVIPGSHRTEFDRSRFDGELFFRGDVSENQALIATRKFVELEPGDVLFFHCRTLHAATRNQSGAMKVSVVYTFRPGDSPPIAGSRSASLPEVHVGK
jgi:phytanoyl-CoA hydroxylase